MFNFKLEMNDIAGAFPRWNDKFLNQMFEDIGYCLSERLRLNRVKVYQEVLYFSDVTTSSGGEHPLVWV